MSTKWRLTMPVRDPFIISTQNDTHSPVNRLRKNTMKNRESNCREQWIKNMTSFLTDGKVVKRKG
uniref:Ovule protein n=1 Tax=Heterorhabditis bacteriophora TaxID=37862 RepID=A0A1I7X988_HETBA